MVKIVTKLQLFVFLALLCCVIAAVDREQVPLVHTSSGAVVGVRDGQTNVFKGIPYAAPPVGSLRLRISRNTINYRLGALGFVGLKTLLEQEGSTGNYGLLDQVMAMNWTRQNIGAFGGNPQMITIGGESAGATSVYSHLVSGASQGAFRQAIAESPAPGEVRTLQLTISNSLSISKTVGCTGVDNADTVKCLREQPYTSFVSASTQHALIKYGPTIDGAVLKDQIFALMQAGLISNAVPLLTGSNHNEGSTFMDILIGMDVSRLELDLLIKTTYSRNSSEVFKLYPYSQFPSYFWVGSAIIGDSALKCTSRHGAQLMQAHGGVSSVYLYQFAHNDSALAFWKFGNNANNPFGAYHGAELPFVFDFSGRVAYPYTAVERQLQQEIMARWAAFVTTSDPNPSSWDPSEKLHWPKYTARGDNNILFTYNGSHPVEGVQQAMATPERCDFWNAYFAETRPNYDR